MDINLSSPTPQATTTPPMAMLLSSPTSQEAATQH
jgi:hypothetical protein